MSLLELGGLMADRRYPDPGFNVNYLAMFLAFRGSRDDDMTAAISLAQAQADLEDWKSGVTVPEDACHFLSGFWAWMESEGLTGASERGSELREQLSQAGVCQADYGQMAATEIADRVHRFQHARYGPYRSLHIRKAEVALKKGDLGSALASAVEARKFDPGNPSSAAVVREIRERVNSELPQVEAEEIVQSVRSIDGWFSDADALLLARCVSGAPHSAARLVVEIGSYKGRSTTLIGLTVKKLGLPLRIITIDPHVGYPFGDQSDTHDALMSNLRRFDLLGHVEVRRARSLDVRIDEQVALAFIDGMHDPESVSRDVGHLLDKIAPSGLIALHDYSDHFPGVIATARILLEDPAYKPVGLEEKFLVVRKLGA